MNGFFSRISGFFSNNVAQAVNRASAEGQFGFININQMQSTDIDLEKNIIENAASYGMQLGIIVDSLKVVIENVDLKEDEHEALRRFSDMAKKIDDVKRNHAAPAIESIDRFINNIMKLEKSDPEVYEKIRDRLRKELFAEPNK